MFAARTFSTSGLTDLRPSMRSAAALEMQALEFTFSLWPLPDAFWRLKLLNLTFSPVYLPLSKLPGFLWRAVIHYQKITKSEKTSKVIKSIFVWTPPCPHHKIPRLLIVWTLPGMVTPVPKLLSLKGTWVQSRMIQTWRVWMGWLRGAAKKLCNFGEHGWRTSPAPPHGGELNYGCGCHWSSVGLV